MSKSASDAVQFEPSCTANQDPRLQYVRLTPNDVNNDKLMIMYCFINVHISH